jgi:hypothetical protein
MDQARRNAPDLQPLPTPGGLDVRRLLLLALAGLGGGSVLAGLLYLLLLPPGSAPVEAMRSPLPRIAPAAEGTAAARESTAPGQPRDGQLSGAARRD